jgi:hypothetical protein
LVFLRVLFTENLLCKPNGTLGKYVIPALAAHGFDITVITRHVQRAAELKHALVESKAVPPDAEIRIQQGDYTSAEALAPSLKGHDSVVSLLNRDETEARMVLVDATILAGVKHIVPAAFGVDTRVPEIRALPHLAAAYIKSEDHLRKAVAESNNQTTFTIIHTGLFLEWGFQYGTAVNFVGKGDAPTMVFDDGSVKMSASSLVDIGKAVATAVKKRSDARFQNQLLLMQNIAICQNDLMNIVKELVPDKAWPIVRVDTIEAEAQSQRAFDTSMASGVKAPASAYHGFFARAFFGKGLGLFPKDDNDILEVQRRDFGWLKGLIAQYLVV